MVAPHLTRALPLIGPLLLPLAAASALQALRLWRAQRDGRAIAARTQPYEQRHPQPRRRVLLVGDSTGLGVGAGPELSIAGRLARDWPDAEVHNACRSGASLADVESQLPPDGPPYDLLLLHAGCNDILRGHSLSRIEAQACGLLPRLVRRARQTVWLGPPNLGLAPVFVPPFSWWLSSRTQRACERFRRSAQCFGVRYLNFYAGRRDDIFSADPQRYFARDRIHPSAATYGHCYEQLKRSLVDDLGRSRP
ncbi:MULTISPECIES: GDSL-type esterase/lipase family protein [unclassified Roseateles]|uniref:SGNH/GDSL hydrolase family protein n=1 Tax=unclassified Roseateles TaxID=2626991 RepID=UPI000700BD0E|nr:MULTISPECIES: GDSL-type esterase/lipase family protein [unclassified Roseateles]KQW45803.1 hypothetical protein ASC81_13030 [Pelomonas sp. Root405]KRA72647.1 hypothetical protein ASD88_13030 [Pelomonas sp. Root662]